ncbi:MAG: hypothetical protein J3K34DRAFT_437229 [Monoraphidium minutum]|nr:MAG: hypothetical protein J3K34DRAFT_437229 [Monoraphidium minutum]
MAVALCMAVLGAAPASTIPLCVSRSWTLDHFKAGRAHARRRAPALLRRAARRHARPRRLQLRARSGAPPSTARHGTALALAPSASRARPGPPPLSIPALAFAATRMASTLARHTPGRPAPARRRRHGASRRARAPGLTHACAPCRASAPAYQRARRLPLLRPRHSEPVPSAHCSRAAPSAARRGLWGFCCSAPPPRIRAPCRTLGGAAHPRAHPPP